MHGKRVKPLPLQARHSTPLWSFVSQDIARCCDADGEVGRLEQTYLGGFPAQAVQVSITWPFMQNVLLWLGSGWVK